LFPIPKKLPINLHFHRPPNPLPNNLHLLTIQPGLQPILQGQQKHRSAFLNLSKPLIALIQGMKFLQLVVRNERGQLLEQAAALLGVLIVVCGEVGDAFEEAGSHALVCRGLGGLPLC
jgi:hypothetical protein